VPGEQIQLTAQEVPRNLKALVEQGVIFNACSLQQLRMFGEQFPGHTVTVRINPGRGSGHSNRTNVGGPAASFGIWHEYVDEVLAIAQEHDLTINSMHTHIGSGSDPEVWERVALMSLEICSRFPNATTLSLGGGYKVGRMQGEGATDLQQIGPHVVEAFSMFEGQYGRRLTLEVEPGTFLVANAGVLVASVIDVVDTGQDGYAFIKVDTGMTELTRPSLYGSQHPIVVVSAKGGHRGTREYIISGHCCESGDVLTPAMSTKNYNSFPEAAEVLLADDGRLHLVRERQTLAQVVQNEVVPEFLA
jgi:diaminopimelate decarboxylase